MIEQEQVYTGALHGNCNYTRTEYDNLTGYMTHEYTTEWTAQDGTRYRKICQVINLGRPDRGIPVDPDTLLDQEVWQEDDEVKQAEATRKMMEGKAKAKAERDAVLLERMQEALRDHGPMSAYACGNKLDADKQRVLKMFNRNRHLFYLIGRHDKAWGLVGAEYDPKMVALPKSVVKTRQFLIEHGPTIVPEIVRGLGMPPRTNSIRAVLNKYPDFFYVVGEQPRMGAVPASYIWGVVGVHEAER